MVLVKKNLLNYAQPGRNFSDVGEFMRFLKNAYSDDESFQTQQFISDLSEKIRSSIEFQTDLDVSNISNILNLTNLRLILSLSAFLTDSLNTIMVNANISMRLNLLRNK
jgi:hypothetical protein